MSFLHIKKCISAMEFFLFHNVKYCMLHFWENIETKIKSQKRLILIKYNKLFLYVYVLRHQYHSRFVKDLVGKHNIEFKTKNSKMWMLYDCILKCHITEHRYNNITVEHEWLVRLVCFYFIFHYCGCICRISKKISYHSTFFKI